MNKATLRYILLLVFCFGVFWTTVINRHPILKQQQNPSNVSPTDSASSIESMEFLPQGPFRLSSLKEFSKSLAPKLGIFTTTGLYFSPILAVISAMRERDVGDLNPLPLATMSVSSIAWLAYGFAANDIYVMVASAMGTIASTFYMIGILPLLQNKAAERLRTKKVLWLGNAFNLFLWTSLRLSGASKDTIRTHLGILASTLCIALSGSPLSTIQSVVSTGNSVSILWELTAANVIDNGLWSAYGIAAHDKFVGASSVVGLGLGLIQLVLKLLYPSVKTTQVPSEDFLEDKTEIAFDEKQLQ